MKTIISNSLAVAAIVLLFTLTSCSKDSDTMTSDTTKMEVRLNHATSSIYDEINIDIEAIFINATTDLNSGWRRIELVKSGIYNLLDQNSMDVLLASQEVASGSLRQVRFVLASQNNVIKNNISHPLTASLMIINVQEELLPGAHCRLSVDLDTFRSIVETAPAQYELKPIASARMESN